MPQCLQCVCWIILWDKSFLRDSYKISFTLESATRLNKLHGNGSLLPLFADRCTYICEADSSRWHFSAWCWDYAWAEYEIKCLICTAWWTVTNSCQPDANLNSRIVCSLRSFSHLRLPWDFSERCFQAYKSSRDPIRVPFAHSGLGLAGVEPWYGTACVEAWCSQCTWVMWLV